MNENKNYTYPNNDYSYNEAAESSSFDYKMWIIRIVKAWYLFAISLVLFMSFAYLKNRSWRPTYKSSALVIIEDSKGYLGAQATLLQGFGAEKAYRNVNNQVIMFGSYDLVKRTIEKLPDLHVDYYTQGRFRTTNLYKQSPIKIATTYISPLAYSREFQFTDLGNNEYTITAEETKTLPEYYYKGTYGVAFENSEFFLQIDKTDYFREGVSVYFRLNSIDNLVTLYSSRLAFEFLMKGASVVEASIVGDVPQRDCDFLDALCEEFLADNLARKNDAAIKTVNFIDEQLEGLSDSLKVSENKLKDYKANNFIVASSGGTSLMSEYAKLDAIRTELRLKESYLNYLTQYLQSNVENESIIAPANLGVTDASLTSLVTAFTELQLKRDEVGEKSPLYSKYTRELEAIKQQMNEALANNRVALDIQKKDLEERTDALTEEMRALPYKEQQFLNIQREFKMNDDYYSFLIQKRLDAQIQKASNSPDNIILDKARISSMTNAGTKNKTYSTFLMIALAIPLAFIVLKELLYPSIRTEEEINKLSGGVYPIIAMLRKTYKKVPVIVDKMPRSSIAEAFRIIRTRLGLMLPYDAKQTILITSTQSGDGKSYVAVNMAGIYAMTERKTLLIDFDLRKPSILAYLELRGNKGLVNYLAGHVSLNDAIIKSPDYKFDVLPVGIIPPNPAELMASDGLKNMLDTLKEQYDYIIIDTSPVGLVGDIYSLFKQVDNTIFVVSCEKTNKTFFKNTIRQLKEHNTHNVNIVFNNVNLKKMEYSAYYHNSYGYYGGNYGKGYYGYGLYVGNKDQYFDDVEDDNPDK